jgi:hypothetical protein
MVTILGLLLTALLLVVGPAPARAADPILVPGAAVPWPGKIFVSHDEWALSDEGFRAAPDAAHLAQNLGRWFAVNRPGRFLVYSSSFGLTGQSLAKTMKAAGHAWEFADVKKPLTLQTLQRYNGVFLAGTRTDTSVLIDYVRSGGNVYVAGGTGRNDAELWGRFLEPFGLRFEHRDNRAAGIMRIDSPSPLFAGVSNLMVLYGTPIELIDESSTDASVLLTRDGDVLYAVYDTGAQPVSLLICPEQLPMGKNTPMSFGIAGGPNFDVRTVDRETVRVIGIKPKDFKTDYNFSPAVGALLGRTVVGDCAAQVPDLSLDLLMKVDSLELAKAIEQVIGRPLHDGETVAVTLSGRLKRENGGTPFVGEDLVVVSRPAGTGR